MFCVVKHFECGNEALMIENGGTLTVEGRNTKVEIKLAEHAGFCFGVSRAANLIEKQADEAFKNRRTNG